MRLEFPLPDKVLSPNSRRHWRHVAKAKKTAKGLAILTTSAALVDGIPARFDGYRLHFRFPDMRRRDDDNQIASCKAYLDGISHRLRQDDSEWSFAGMSKRLDRDRPGLTIEMLKDAEDEMIGGVKDELSRRKKGHY